MLNFSCYLFFFEVMFLYLGSKALTGQRGGDAIGSSQDIGGAVLHLNGVWGTPTLPVCADSLEAK